uniref:Uncharacterized protein n=1 Tax=Meloidogyne javanica TaxID=6303 RepID=A0A915LWW4_MELJA
METEWSIVVSIFAIGGITGGLSCGYFADKLGRKAALLLNNVVALIATFFFVFAKLFDVRYLFTAGRLIIGVNAGEYFLTVVMNNVSFVPAILQLSTLMLCPESPKYTIKVGNNHFQAQKDLKKLRGHSNVQDELKLIATEAKTAKTEEISFASLFGQYKCWPLVLSTFLMIAQQLSGINYLLSYSTDMFKSAGLQGQWPNYSTIFLGTINVVMTAVCAYLVDRVGRRKLLVAGFIGMFTTKIFFQLSIILIKDPKAIAYEWEADLQQKSKEAFEMEQSNAIQAIKLEAEKQRKANRRSFLSGSVVVKGMNALNTKRDFVMTSSLLTQSNRPPIAVLSRRKKPYVPPKNRRIDDSYTLENFTQGLQELSPSLMISIKKFCLNLLLKGRYNRLIKTNRDLVVIFNLIMGIFEAFSRRKSSLKATDFHYFTFTTFMLAFSRFSRISCQLFNSTFSIKFFHQITSYLTESFEIMKTDRDNTRKYALSSQYAVSVYREIVAICYNPILPEEKESYSNFCQQLFQVEEYRELAAGILGHLSPGGARRKMLEDLIIVNHYFLHLLENNIREGTLIRIQKRKRQRKQRKELKKKDNDEKKSIEKAVKMKGNANKWVEIAEELSDS